MENRIWMAALLVIAAFSGACATSGGSRDSGNASKRFTAHSIIYNRAPEPMVTTKVFRTDIQTLNRSNLRSYRFNNYITGKKDPDIVVTLALSGARAGLAIYDGAGAPLMEFPSGMALRDLVEFEMPTKEGKMKVRWLLTSEMILSVFEAFDNDGVLGYSENTVYLLK